MLLGVDVKLLQRMSTRDFVNLLYRDNVHVKHHDVKPVLALQTDIHASKRKPAPKKSSWRLAALVKHAMEARGAGSH